MLMDNHWFTEKDELFIYVTNCLKQTSGKSLKDLGTNPNLPSIEQIRVKVYDKLVSYCEPSDSSWNPEEVAEELLNDVPDDKLLSLYFRGDIYHFFEYDEVSTAFKTLMTDGDIAEADYGWVEKNYPDAMEFLNSIWVYIEDWVLAPGLVRDINHKIEVMERKSVILTDTDSTFLTVDPWVKWCESYLEIDNSTDEKQLTVINTMLMLMRLASDHQMEKLTTNMFVPKDFRWLVNFKSEFIYSRLLLTNGKKHYMGLVTFQEGAKRVNADGEIGEIDIKGLSIKKSNLSPYTGRYLTDLVETNIFRKGTEIDRFTLINGLTRFEETIRENILNGGTDFAKPTKVKNPDGYANKFSMDVFRGSLAWNTLYPEERIENSTSALLYQLTPGSDYEQFLNIMESVEYDNKEFIIDTITNLFYNADEQPELFKNGFNWIALPYGIEQMPKWIINLIDIDEIVSKNTSPVLPILESIDIKVISNNNQYTNVVKF